MEHKALDLVSREHSWTLRWHSMESTARPIPMLKPDIVAVVPLHEGQGVFDLWPVVARRQPRKVARTQVTSNMGVFPMRVSVKKKRREMEQGITWRCCLQVRHCRILRESSPQGRSGSQEARDLGLRTDSRKGRQEQCLHLAQPPAVQLLQAWCQGWKGR